MRPRLHRARRLAAAWLTLPTLGCAGSLPAAPPGPQAVTARGPVVLTRPGLRLAAVPQARVAADVAELGVELWESTATDLAELEAEEALAATRSLGPHLSPAAPLAIGNLRPNATYGVRLTAHDGSDVRLDDGSSACLTLLQTATDDEVAATFRVRLADVWFAGSAQATLAVSGAGATPFTAADIATTTLVLHRLPTGETSQTDVAATADVSLVNLRRNTSYTLEARAVDASGNRIDDCEVATGPCTVTFSVGVDDSLAAPVTVPVVLRDHPQP